MNNYSELIQQMAEAFITAVRTLETENARLRSENELLELRLRETEEQTDQWFDWRDEIDREEKAGL